MKELFKIEDLVIEILMADSAARNSDDALYFKVIQRINSEALDAKLGHILTGFNAYNLPRFATVSRARRKVQAQRPELCGDKKVSKGRQEKAILFEEYAVR